jgi:LmbE family N-acetylglucosaminyl deacetylase
MGGRNKLVKRISETLDKFKPDYLLGFDPRHGTSCHPNHRESPRKPRRLFCVSQAALA